MMTLRSLLPDTLFGRLFAATVGVIGLLMLTIVLLIVRERRELALLDSGSGSSASTIAQTSEYLAGLPQTARDEARVKLRQQRLLPDDVRPRLRIKTSEQAALQRAFAEHLQRQLGPGYRVSAGPPRAPRDQVIPLHLAPVDRRPTEMPPGEAPPAGGAMRVRHFDRVFDVTITLPDGDAAVFRTLAPRSGPRLPRFIFVHGNRDFLIGRKFTAETGVKLLSDPTLIQLYGQRVLLMHGDTLCIDDPNYQRLRRIVRNPVVQFIMRRLTLRQRLNLAARMREGSKAHIASMDKAAPQIMDVNQDEVRRTFEHQRVDFIVHGHTHRPSIHKVQLGTRTVTRIVLGDWYEQGSVLRWNERGYELAGLNRGGEITPATPSGTETGRPAM